MRKIDEKFLKSSLIFTFFALTGYFALNYIAKSHVSNTADSNVGINQAPLVVIDTLQGYWLFGYLLLLGVLVLHWTIKRVTS
ncbi:hypothetical protein PKHYL_40660 [Psychrobacter sp. KH172YL61]|jgi:hypothetical protein|uniref:hypothetical protein n=1 Tax=Psychrobacter sp. KH172YL61 TaxID=2517899 RepID=UPI0010B2EC1F|nr:hypothetical protein [Psychrobacter sp. KH172YL61]BBI69875.1 hypothetical protein PKHYL_40660 [Psychrobacter sp. KH172YL61]